MVNLNIPLVSPLGVNDLYTKGIINVKSHDPYLCDETQTQA